MNCKRMKEEQENFDDGHATSSMKRGEREGEEERDWEIAMDIRIREERDRVIDDYGIATMTSVMDARRDRNERLNGEMEQ